MRALLAFVFLLSPYTTQLAHAEAYNQPKVHLDPALRLYDSARVTQAANLPDGSVVLVGDFDEYAGLRVDGIVRLFPDGSVDSSFTPSLTTGIYHSNATDVVVMGDKLYVAGSFLSVDGIDSPRVARFQIPGLELVPGSFGVSINGPVDAIEGIGGDLLVSAENMIRRYDLDADGSAANWITIDTWNQAAIDIKVSSQGTVYALTNGDRIYAYSGSTGEQLFVAPVPTPDWNWVLHFDLSADGDLIIAGDFHATATTGPAGLIRVDGTTGLLDPAWVFHSDDPNAAFGGVLALADGGAIVTGDFTQINGTPTAPGIARINADGTVRPSWGGVHASAKSEFLHAVDDTLFLVGERPADGSDCSVQAAHVGDGLSASASFSSSTLTKDAEVYQIQMDADALFVGGRLTRAGDFRTDGILKLDGSIAIDPSFSANLVGDFYSPPGASSFAVGGGYIYMHATQLIFEQSADPENPYWIRDHQLSAESGEELPMASYGNQPVFLERVSPLYNPADGKFYLLRRSGGQGQSLPNSGILRYRPDTRQTDTSWSPSHGNLGYSRAAVIAGDYYYYGGYRSAAPGTEGEIARVRISDAIEDTSWNPGYAPRVETMGVDANQEWIYVGSSYDSAHGLSRISTITGMVDPDWMPLAALPTSFGRVDSIFLADDGYVYIGGSFNGLSCDPSRTIGGALRLTAAGTIDPTWHINTDYGYLGVRAMHKLSNGKIAVGGSFERINGVLSPGFAIVDSTTDVIFMDQIGDAMCIP